MKIAFLTPEYPHTKTGTSGGIGTSIKNLAAALKLNGSEVSILVYGQNSDGLFQDNGIDIHQIQNIKFKGLSWYLTRKKIQKKIDFLYSEKKIDLIEVVDWTGITSFITLKKCPIVIKLHGSDAYFCDLEDRKAKFWNKFHEKRALQKADFHTAVSRFVATETSRVFRIKKQFTIIPNGVNMIDFGSDNSSNPNQILYFGSLIRKKGLLELPMIFNKIHENNPNAKLILAGKDVPDIATKSASTWALMQKLFAENALQNVTYLGVIPYENIRKIIQESTVCVFPSFAEAFPVSWLEAMAMKKAIVASNIGWAIEVVTNKVDGFLVNPKKHEEFAEKVAVLLKNESLNVSFGKNAQQKMANTFDINIIAQKNLDFYQSIINSKK